MINGLKPTGSMNAAIRSTGVTLTLSVSGTSSLTDPPSDVSLVTESQPSGAGTQTLTQTPARNRGGARISLQGVAQRWTRWGFFGERANKEFKMATAANSKWL